MKDDSVVNVIKKGNAYLCRIESIDILKRQGIGILLALITSPLERDDGVEEHLVRAQPQLMLNASQRAMLVRQILHDLAVDALHVVALAILLAEVVCLEDHHVGKCADALIEPQDRQVSARREVSKCNGVKARVGRQGKRPGGHDDARRRHGQRSAARSKVGQLRALDVEHLVADVLVVRLSEAREHAGLDAS